MGGEVGRDLAAVGLGLTDAFTTNALQSLMARRERERQTRVTTGTSLSEEGLFHQLDEKTAKSLAGGDKDLFEALTFRSQLKFAQLEPRREAQRDFLSLVNAPEVEQIPGGVVTISEPRRPVQAATTQIPPLDPLGLPIAGVGVPPNILPEVPSLPPLGVETAPRRPNLREPVSLVIPEVPQQAIPLYVPQQSSVTIQTPASRVERIPTASERAARIEGLSPVGVAIAFNDNQLGTLAVQHAQNQSAAEKLEFDRSKEAMKQMQPKYATTFDGLDADGNPTKMALFYMPNGTTNIVNLGPGAASGAAQRALAAMRRIETTLLDPTLSAQRRAELETNLARQTQLFMAAQERTNINLPEQPQIVRSFDGTRYLGTVTPGDEVTRRRLQSVDLALQTAGPAEIKRDRSTIFEGNIALDMIDDILKVATPENVGVVGSARRTAQGLASLLQTAPRIGTSIQNLIGVARTEVQRAESVQFRDRLLQQFDASPDFLDATIRALAVLMAKVRDPTSVVREGEYQVALDMLQGEGGIFGSGFPGFRARIEVARRDIIRRQRAARLNQLNTIGTIRTLLGDPGAEVPLIDPSQNLRPESDPLQTGEPNIPGLPQQAPDPATVPTQGTQTQDLGGGAAASGLPRGGLSSQELAQRERDVTLRINRILGDFGLSAIPDEVSRQLNGFATNNRDASATQIMAAFELIMNDWALRNNIQRVR